MERSGERGHKHLLRYHATVLRVQMELVPDDTMSSLRAALVIAHLCCLLSLYPQEAAASGLGRSGRMSALFGRSSAGPSPANGPSIIFILEFILYYLFIYAFFYLVLTLRSIYYVSYSYLLVLPSLVF